MGIVEVTLEKIEQEGTLLLKTWVVLGVNKVPEGLKEEGGLGGG